MHAKAAGFVVVAAFAAAASGQKSAAQDVDRVFYLTHTGTPQQIQEIAVVIRSVADIRQVAVVNEQQAVTVHGTGDQIRMAEWLVNELNRPAPDPPPAVQIQNSTTHEYRQPGVANDVVRVFYITWSRTPQELQEIVTLVRSIADVQRIFIYNSLKAIAARGTPEQIALTEWLVNELNKPAREQAPAPQNQTVAHEYRMPASSDQAVRVFYLAHAGTPQELQEIAVTVRSVTDMKRLFINNAQKAVASRGTLDQIASAERLIKELDKPKVTR